METGIYMRYGFEGPRKGIWKSKELEQAICETFGCSYAQLTSSGTSALTTAMAALGIGAGDEIISSDRPYYSMTTGNSLRLILATEDIRRDYKYAVSVITTTNNESDLVELK